MTHARITDSSDGRLQPWQQPKESYRNLLQSQLSDVIEEHCSRLHSTSFSEIDSVAEANDSVVCQHANGRDEEEGPEVASPEDAQSDAETLNSQEQTTPKCHFSHGKTASEKLKSFGYTCRKCYCTYIDEGERGTMCTWGGVKTKARTQPTGSSGSKRKPYTHAFQRLCAEYKYKPFEFRHESDVGDYMTQYRRQHTVADVGREIRAPPQFGVDVPDPYVIRIKNICSIVDSCDITALLPTDTDHSCSDFNSVISTTSGDSGAKDKDKGHEKTPPGEKTKRKKGEKPPLVNTKSVPSLALMRQKKSGNQPDLPHSRRADVTKTLRNYVEEYEHLRRERDALQKSNTLPQILLRADADSTRPSSDASSATRRLIDELDSPLKRLLQHKQNKGPMEFLRETCHQKSTSVKLSEFLSTALLGDDRLRTAAKSTSVVKQSVKVKAKPKGDHKEQKGTHLPELVGQTCDRRKDYKKVKGTNESQPCAKVLSVSLDEIEVPSKSTRNPQNSPTDDKLPLDYQLKKRKIHKVVDLMSIAR